MSDAGNDAGLVFFLFDLLYRMAKTSLRCHSLSGRRGSLALLADVSSPRQYSDHQAGYGRAFFEWPCALSVEGIVSKRIDAPYVPSNRGLWRKVKCLHREEFVVVVGSTDPEGARSWLGALLLGYYDPDGRLVYAGRAGTGIDHAELERLWRRLQPLAIPQDAARPAAAAR